jgi:hypothetical protein
MLHQYGLPPTDGKIVKIRQKNIFHGKSSSSETWRLPKVLGLRKLYRSHRENVNQNVPLIGLLPNNERHIR